MDPQNLSVKSPFPRPSTMVGDKETPPQCSHHDSHGPGHANYQNNVFVLIIEKILPNGAEVWC